MTHHVEGAPIILVGLPGAGKTTAGRLAAARLGWTFVDLDEAIVAASGRSIPELFAAEGEAGFREREREATRGLVGARRLVIAPGGGWMTNPGCPELLRPPGRIIHLRVGVATALDRVARSGAVRPLLAGPEPAAALAALHARRAAAYASVDAEVDTETLDLQGVAEFLARLASAGGAA